MKSIRTLFTTATLLSSVIIANGAITSATVFWDFDSVNGGSSSETSALSGITATNLFDAGQSTIPSWVDSVSAISPAHYHSSNQAPSGTSQGWNVRSLGGAFGLISFDVDLATGATLESFSLSFWLRPNSTAGLPSVEVVYEVNDIETQVFSQASTVDGGWEPAAFSTGTYNITGGTTGDTGTGVVTFKIRGVGTDWQNISYDDVTFTAVPEQSTYAILFGLGAFGLVLIRRRMNTSRN